MSVSDGAGADLRRILDREGVLDLVVALFVATDRRDWTRVEACLANQVLLDMTSLTGGEPVRLTPSEVAAGWREGLRAIEHVHHQVGNFQVRIDGDAAQVFCYGVALHHRSAAEPDGVRAFVGSYDIGLRRQGDAWRIDRFRYDSKFLAGNLRLEAAGG